MNDRETFRFLSREWDISKAKEVLRKSSREPHPFRVEELAKLLWLIRVDQEHAKTVDIGKPVILATIEVEMEGSFVIPVDGWHRISRAVKEGRKTLDGYVLTAEESKAVEL